jgi:hypothetical protein
LSSQRGASTGPAHYMVGRLIKYDQHDLDRWLASQRRASDMELLTIETQI